MTGLFKIRKTYTDLTILISAKIFNSFSALHIVFNNHQITHPSHAQMLVLCLVIYSSMESERIRRSGKLFQSKIL